MVVFVWDWGSVYLEILSLLLLPDITIINLDAYWRLLAINVCKFYFPRHTKDIPNDFDMHDHAAGSPNRAMRILPIMHNNKAWSATKSDESVNCDPILCCTQDFPTDAFACSCQSPAIHDATGITSLQICRVFHSGGEHLLGSASTTLKMLLSARSIFRPLDFCDINLIPLLETEHSTWKLKGDSFLLGRLPGICRTVGFWKCNNLERPQVFGRKNCTTTWRRFVPPTTSTKQL